MGQRQLVARVQKLERTLNETLPLFHGGVSALADGLGVTIGEVSATPDHQGVAGEIADQRVRVQLYPTARKIIFTDNDAQAVIEPLFVEIGTDDVTEVSDEDHQAVHQWLFRLNALRAGKPDPTTVDGIRLL